MEELITQIINKVNASEKRWTIGISGHGASGKTTFSNKLTSLLGEENVSYLNTDPYIVSSDVRKHSLINYTFEGVDYEYKMTACHPAAHNSTILERDIHVLKEGKDFLSITNDYVTGKWMPPKNITIIEGMTVAFVNPELIDLMIYFYTDAETELERRYGRDIFERGTKKEYLTDSHSHRRMQYDVFMHPYSKQFDIIIKSMDEEIIIEKNTIY